MTRQPSDRRPAGVNASLSGSSSAGGAGAAGAAGGGGAAGGSTSVTDNGNSSVHHHVHSQGSFSSPKNGSAGGLPVTVTDAIASQCIDIHTSLKEGEKHLR